jgi:hypothetical protein
MLVIGDHDSRCDPDPAQRLPAAKQSLGILILDCRFSILKVPSEFGKTGNRQWKMY